MRPPGLPCALTFLRRQMNSKARAHCVARMLLRVFRCRPGERQDSYRVISLWCSVAIAFAKMTPCGYGSWRSPGRRGGNGANPLLAPANSLTRAVAARRQALERQALERQALEPALEPSTSGTAPSARSSRRTRRSHRTCSRAKPGSHGNLGNHRTCSRAKRLAAGRRHSPCRRDGRWRGSRRPFPLRQERNADRAGCYEMARYQQRASWMRMRSPPMKDRGQRPPVSSRRRPCLCPSVSQLASSPWSHSPLGCYSTSSSKCALGSRSHS